MNNTVLKILNILGFAGMLAVNAAASLVPINNLTMAEVSGMYPALFTPAGYVFSIWGLIYLLLLGFVIYQARDLFSSQKLPMPFVERIGPCFFISCLLNAAWIFAWHYLKIGLSLVIMLALLATLIFIYLRLNAKQDTSPHFWVHLPFRVYLGWIIIATIANVSALLVSVGWQWVGLRPDLWTVAMIVAAVAITSVFIWRYRDWAVAAVAVWGLVGIAVARLPAGGVVTGVGCAAIVACVFIVMQLLTVYTDPKEKA